MGIFSSLNREQKESVGLLSIGTFLEYFDLMLYVHMAVLLNDIFFPKYDSHTASLLAAFAFCSTFVFRPIGALIFGWIGDNLGRKVTLILTTTIMSFSCILMANLPTYEQIGITAAWIVTLCRISQGMSSMGEIMGAEIYVAESISRPASYPAVALISIASSLGGLAALGVATLVTSYYMNWRLAFWIGAGIALVGAVARSRLRETPEFLEMKRQQIQEGLAKEGLTKTHKKSSKEERHPLYLPWKERIWFDNLKAFFMIYCGWPLCFYLALFYFTSVLQNNFGYSSEDIIKRNFLLYVVMLIGDIFWTFLSCHIHPIKIIKARGRIALLLMILMPFLTMTIDSSAQLFLLQAMILLFPLVGMPAEAVLMYHLPISRRFTFASFLYALTRALMYIITAFGLVYLGDYFGSFGLWFITLPAAFAFLYGVRHFEDLERKMGMLELNPFYKTALLKKSRHGIRLRKQ